MASGLLLAYVYVALRDFRVQSLEDKYRILCDAFTTPAVLLIMTAALIAISNSGALNGIAYALSQGIGIFIPGRGIGTESYADYLERKRDRKISGYSFLLISGVIFLAVALIFMFLFYSV